MKKVLIVGAVVAGAVGALIPLEAAHAASPTVPAACVVVNGPSGATIQVGYAPTGPSGCQQLP